MGGSSIVMIRPAMTRLPDTEGSGLTAAVGGSADPPAGRDGDVALLGVQPPAKLRITNATRSG